MFTPAQPRYAASALLSSLIVCALAGPAAAALRYDPQPLKDYNNGGFMFSGHSRVTGASSGTLAVGYNTNSSPGTGSHPVAWGADGWPLSVPWIGPSSAPTFERAIGVSSRGDILTAAGTTLYLYRRLQNGSYQPDRTIGTGTGFPLVPPVGDVNDSRAMVAGSPGSGGSVYVSPTQTVTRLSMLPVALNNAGQFVGDVPVIGTVMAGAQVLTPIPLPDGVTFRGAQDINDAGLVVGGVLVGGAERPFAYSAAGGFSTLDVPAGFTSGRAYGVNNAGDIVGSVSDGTRDVAAIWRSAGAFEDLNASLEGFPVWRATIAERITDDGVIVTRAQLDEFHLFARLIPVPEPAMAAFAPLVVLATARRRR